jgi:two-component system chemotaxis response regulator CheY
MRVLVVDDSTLIRTAAAKALADTTYELVTATNGQEGLDVLDKNHDISIIFSDVNMPVMGGMDMVKKISTNPTFSHIPIVMLTTESGANLKAKAKGMGIKAWMVKPFNKEKFLYAISKLVK